MKSEYHEINIVVVLFVKGGRNKQEQEAPRSIMSRRATGVNLLAFSVAMLSQRSYRRKPAHWAKCLHLGVSQVVSECMSRLNRLMGLPAGSKQSLEI